MRDACQQEILRHFFEHVGSLDSCGPCQIRMPSTDAERFEDVQRRTPLYRLPVQALKVSYASDRTLGRIYRECRVDLRMKDPP